MMDDENLKHSKTWYKVKDTHHKDEQTDRIKTDRDAESRH